MSVQFVGNRRTMTLMIPVETQSGGSEQLVGHDSMSGTISEDGQLIGVIGKGEGYDAETYRKMNVYEREAALGKNYLGGANGNKPYGVYNEGGTSTTGNMPVTTIIPDAYQVSLTLTELIPESQNTMFAAIHKPNTITISTSDQNVYMDEKGEEQKVGFLNKVADAPSGSYPLAGAMPGFADQ